MKKARPDRSGRAFDRPVFAWAQPPAVPAAAAPAEAMSRQLEQLTQLGQLRAAGILTDAEFEAKKAIILAS